MDRDLEHLRHAVHLAHEARRVGNLPVGAVITLDGEVIAEGMNSIWVPTINPSRHAEIEALDAVPAELWARRWEMTLYTTLEPCLMCLGTILVQRIDRVVFGSNDSRGGASCVFGHMPPAFERLFAALEWVGPALPEECDELAEAVLAILDERGSRMWERKTDKFPIGGG
jgi:tRNA(adenine34) deaminase